MPPPGPGWLFGGAFRAWTSRPRTSWEITQICTYVSLLAWKHQHYNMLLRHRVKKMLHTNSTDILINIKIYRWYSHRTNRPIFLWIWLDLKNWGGGSLSWFIWDFNICTALQTGLKHCIPFCTIHIILCQSLESSCSHSLSLLSLSEYAPNRLRDDDPFCVVTGLEASVVAGFESEKQDKQRLCLTMKKKLTFD